MIDLNDEILIDFIAESEDYYQTVRDAMSMLDQGQVQEAVSAMLRPLHTIKGTSGFISGLEKLKTYTHQVEDILKNLQAGEYPNGSDHTETLKRAVDEVFNLLDQVRTGHTELDDSGATSLLAGLRDALEGRDRGASTRWFPPRIITDDKKLAPGRREGKLAMEIRQGVLFIKVEMTRLHLVSQCSPLTEAVAQADPQHPVVIDLSEVRTISSTAWGEIWEAGMGHQLFLIGMNQAVLATYGAWGLDSAIRSFPDEPAFWREYGEDESAQGETA